MGNTAGDGESLPVSLTLESVSASTAIIKWRSSSAHSPVSASSPRLLIRRLDQLEGLLLGGEEDSTVRVVVTDWPERDGHYQLEELMDGQMYSVQMVVDQPHRVTTNLSNVLYFTTPDGLFSG